MASSCLFATVGFRTAGPADPIGMAIGEGHLHLRGLVDYMAVGQDEPIRRKDKPGATPTDLVGGGGPRSLVDPAGDGRHRC